MVRNKILAVDDEKSILELVAYHLTREGFQVTTAGNGEEAQEKIQTFPPDLVVLDIMLPGVDGLEICRRLKMEAATRHISVLLLSAKTEETDVLAGLELGADDYLAKPFSPKVLVARTKALLRRRLKKEVSPSEVIETDALSIHPGKMDVKVLGRSVNLTVSEFKALHCLAQRPGWVFSRNQMIDAIRGDNYPVTDRTIDVLMVSLRRKLGRAGDIIDTVRGVGYRFKDAQSNTNKSFIIS